MFSFGEYCLFFKVVDLLHTTTASLCSVIVSFPHVNHFEKQFDKIYQETLNVSQNFHLSMDSSNCKDRKRYYRSGFGEAETRDHRLNLARRSPSPVTAIPCLWLFVVF